MPEEAEGPTEWSWSDGVSSFPEFQVGDTIHDIPYGQGIGKILEFERQDDGQWTKVRVRYVSGCIPMSSGKLPRDTTWMEREELEARWSPER